MNQAIQNTYPTAAEAQIVQIYIPSEGWTSQGDLMTLAHCVERGATLVCVRVLDSAGEVITDRADFTVSELVDGAHADEQIVWDVYRGGGDYSAVADIHGLYARIDANRAEDLMGNAWTDSYTVSVGLFAERDFPAAGHHTPQGALAEARRWAATVARIQTIS